MRTDTTKSLTQHAYNTARYGDDIQIRGSLRNLSRSLTRVRGDITKTLLEEDFSRPIHSEHSSSQSALNEALRDALNNRRPSGDLLTRSDWFTKPIHLSESVYLPVTTDEALANQLFPVTLRESKTLEMLEDVRPCRGENRKRMSKSAKPVYLPATRDDVRRMDNTYYLTSEAPSMSE